jgi:diacylglycerol kinase family enzyme
VKISLLYSRDAGAGVSEEDLRGHLEHAGHEVVRALGDASEFARALDEPVELVVAAGGDGTISAAACTLAGQPIALAILPVGTANNIGRSLGIRGPLPDLIARWHDARPEPLDLGLVRGAWHGRFVEGVGSGWIARGIAAPQAQSSPEETGRDWKLVRALGVYRELLRELEPRRLRLTLDGTVAEGDFVLVEVLNIGSIGPNLVLAPGASASDGWLEVVTAGDEHRHVLDEYVQRRLEGREGRLSLPVRRAREVEIDGPCELHVDGEARTGLQPERVSIGIEPGAVQLLV